jgi:aminoglycoside phosphotransferase (APT) family kinase protein
VIEDPLLPAARHLVGADAADLLRVAVAHAGGRLEEAAVVQVQHRPGHELVARYDALVAWGDAPARRETLLAAATADGAPAGTLPLQGDGLEAGVWRYPFDPALPALEAAVTPVDRERLEVVAYRPTRRAVVRVTTPDGAITYRKVVRPREAAGLVAVHGRLAEAGLPVPAVLQADPDAGLLTLEGLGGENLRDRLLGAQTGWPPTAQLVELIDAVSQIDLGTTVGLARLSLADATAGHARALLAILPDEGGRLARLTGAVADVRRADPPRARTVHGDLYEAQIMVTGDQVSGLLDLDDVHLGDPLEDAAVMVAHLHLLRPGTRAHRAHLGRYRRRLRDALTEAFAPGGDRAELDRRTAAVLVGLSTGSFRAQRRDWQAEARRRLAVADRVLRAGRADEETLRVAS